jgi:hypothetical protein
MWMDHSDIRNLGVFVRNTSGAYTVQEFTTTNYATAIIPEFKAEVESSASNTVASVDSQCDTTDLYSANFKNGNTFLARAYVLPKLYFDKYLEVKCTDNSGNPRNFYIQFGNDPFGPW